MLCVTVKRPSFQVLLSTLDIILYIYTCKIMKMNNFIINVVIIMLLKSDVTRRDHVSVVMDPMNVGSRIVNFIVNLICDGTVFA